MKIITPGHKYELANFEPNPELANLKGLGLEAYKACILVEFLPPSEAQTKAVMAVSELQQKLQKLEYANQTIQFIEKTQAVPGHPELKTVNNGTTNEEVLTMLIDRMRSLYAKFPSPETDHAIGHLQSALFWQEERTRRRAARGVEGKAMA